jgi:putative ABC transport system permease protein
MFDLLFVIISQAIPFIPLALAIYISFNLLNATDMTLDGSFVAGAGMFAHCIDLHISPPIAALLAISIGILTGLMVASFQRSQRIDALLAGILATFILTGLNLIMMGRPNISLLNQTTLLSHAFSISEGYGYGVTAIYTGIVCLSVILLLLSRVGLNLRAFGDNPQQMARYGFNIEKYRMIGFALTNCLAASAGCLTAQTVGYADINMGFGVTLTALGAIILGQELFVSVFKKSYLRPVLEFSSCLAGVIIYFASINSLLRMQVDPIYLKIILGFVLVIFLRTSSRKKLI